jgi:hypothetical protein
METTLRTARGAFGASAALALVVALLGGAEGAAAGTYHVYACRTPAGEGAPSDGWRGSTSGEAVVQNTCSQPGGALLAAVPVAERVANTDMATWSFLAPPGARIAGATLWRAGEAYGGATATTTYGFWIGGASRVNAFEECVYSMGCVGRGDPSVPLAGENVVTLDGASLGEGLYVGAACSGVRERNCEYPPPIATAYGASVHVFAADVTLDQAAGPTVMGVGGGLTESATVRGTSEVTFTASDVGAGVYATLVSVDGAVVQRAAVDDNSGRCRDAGGTRDGSAAFLYVRPCAASASASVGLDTTTLANGAHHVVVSVVDAAGNSAAVLDRTLTVANPPPCAARAVNAGRAAGGAVLSASWRGKGGVAITAAFGNAHTIDGVLRSVSGAPIGGAPVEVSLAATAGSAPPKSTIAHTRADGRFSISVPGGPSRTVCLAFRSGAEVATRALTLRVRAPVTLRVSPRTAAVGRTIRFRGRLRGGDVPAGGQPVVLEARSPGARWLQFKVVRSDARGRFHASYRFRFAGPARYEFRALCEPASDYPFARGYSHVVRVRER